MSLGVQIIAIQINLSCPYEQLYFEPNANVSMQTYLQYWHADKNKLVKHVNILITTKQKEHLFICYH